MGHPNWKRLAELGQLPDYMKEQVTPDILSANQQSLRTKNEEPNKEVEQIESAIGEVTSEDVRAELEKKTNKELMQILEEKGLDSKYEQKNVLIDRILEGKKVEEVETTEEKVESEKVGEFIDDLLQ